MDARAYSLRCGSGVVVKECRFRPSSTEEVSISARGISWDMFRMPAVGTVGTYMMIQLASNRDVFQLMLMRVHTRHHIT